MVESHKYEADLRAQRQESVVGFSREDGKVTGINRQENAIGDRRKKTADRVAWHQVDRGIEYICLLIRRTYLTAPNAALVCFGFPFPFPFASRSYRCDTDEVFRGFVDGVPLIVPR